MTAEKNGVAATAIITDRFELSAKVLAGASGMADYPFAVIAHPISNNSDDLLREKAELAVRQCLDILIKK